MSYYRVRQKTSQLTELRQKAVTRGENTGFEPLDKILSLKKGYPLFVAGAPHSGKTELIIEILLNTSVLYGWKHFVYLGENGEIEEVIADLCFKYIGKPYKMTDFNPMTESERVYAEMFIDNHFVFLSDEKDLTLSQFFELVEEAEKNLNIKFDTTLFDPFNDLVDESKEYGGTHHWLNIELKKIRKISKKAERLDILINHIADVETQIDKETKQPYIRAALPNEWNGGRTWWRRGYLMLLIYRPPAWLKDLNGEPYGENVSLVIVQKAKPKGVAKYGATGKLFWDWKINRYYWLDGYSNRKYAFEVAEKQEEIKLTPNKEFDDDLPY